MLRSTNAMIGYVLDANDATIGRCKDFLFDDEQWAIRYMVADTRKWLPGRKVLISPISFDGPDWRARRFPVRLSKTQIKEAPGLDEHAPVSRQYEIRFFRHYRWPFYWSGGGLWGTGAIPSLLYASKAGEEPASDPVSGDRHLRSAGEVKGYGVQATDYEIGHVADFLVDDESWSIRYMVVDTRNWLPGKKVVISPSRIGHVDLATRRVEVLLTRAQVEESPEFESARAEPSPGAWSRDAFPGFEDIGGEDMNDEHSELMSRVDKKRRELELAVEKITGDHAGVMTEEADAIERNLDYLKEILENGAENLSDETIRKLEQWLPQK